MNIKYISLLSLLFVTGANAIMPEEIIDAALSRLLEAREDLLKCQQSKDSLRQCMNEKDEVATKGDEYNKVMLKMKDFLNTTVQQGKEATVFDRQKNLRAKRAKLAIHTIIQNEQLPYNKYNTSSFSRELLQNTSVNIINMPGDKETIEQFNNDLYATIPNQFDCHFIRKYKPFYSKL